MGIEMYKKMIDKGLPGDNVGILVKGISKKDLKKPKEYVLAKPGTIEVSKKFIGRVYVLTSDEGGRKQGFSSKYKPQFFFKVANFTGSIKILEKEIDIAKPGELVLLEVTLMTPYAINKNDRFVIREGNLTIGGGVINEVLKG